MAQTLFVTGAHTEIGKTFVAACILEAARAGGLSVEVLKPVVSDFDPAHWADSDPGRLLAAAGAPLTAAALDAISPWRFAAPLAPPAAARLEGQALPFDPIRAFVQARLAASTADLVVVEGVGGLMSPIADAATSLDLLRATAGDSLLVVGSYLGAVSHGLTALEVMRVQGRAPRALVLSERGDAADPALEGTIELLREHLADVPLAVAAHGRRDWAQPLLAELRGARGRVVKSNCVPIATGRARQEREGGE